MALGNGLAGTAFEVGFEVLGGRFVVEDGIGDERPGYEVGCMWGSAGVIGLEARCEVFSEADIGLVGRGGGTRSTRRSPCGWGDLGSSCMKESKAISPRNACCFGRHAFAEGSLRGGRSELGMSAGFYFFWDCAQLATRSLGEGWWWAMTGSNRRPTRCKRAALPAELIALSREGTMCQACPHKSRGVSTSSANAGVETPLISSSRSAFDGS